MLEQVEPDPSLFVCRTQAVSRQNRLLKPRQCGKLTSLDCWLPGATVAGRVSTADSFVLGSAPARGLASSTATRCRVLTRLDDSRGAVANLKNTNFALLLEQVDSTHQKSRVSME
jgi:hypothetical protein